MCEDCPPRISVWRTLRRPLCRGQSGAVRPRRVPQMEETAEADFLRLATYVGVGRWLLLLSLGDQTVVVALMRVAKFGAGSKGKWTDSFLDMLNWRVPG